MNSKTKGRTSPFDNDDNDDDNDDNNDDDDDDEDEASDRKVKEYFHYLHEIKFDGPVGLEGSLRPGDRLLQVVLIVVINFNKLC